MLVLLFFPIFCFAQFGNRDCHVDLIFGYDYGKYNVRSSITSASSLHSFRFGTNITNPIFNNSALVTGFRIASKTSTFYRSIEGEEHPITTTWNNFFVEIPFMLRHTIKNIDLKNRIFVEGGLQFNLYAFSMRKQLISSAPEEEMYDKELNRYSEINNFTLGTNFSIGWEKEIQRHLKFFVQTVGRLQLFSDRRNPTNQSYHLGIETGLRF